MPYADDAEHLAAIDRRLEVARNTAPELVWLDEKPDWWGLDVPFLRQQLTAAQAESQRLRAVAERMLGTLKSVAQSWEFDDGITLDDLEGEIETLRRALAEEQKEQG